LGLNGTAKDFGYLIAELALLGARLYAERFNQPEGEMLIQILEGFDREVHDQSGNPMGGIGDDV
jgi:hypothetical protein